jgi:hypothetical protein
MSGNLGKGFLIGLVLFILGWIFSAIVGMVIGAIPMPLFLETFLLNIVQAVILPIQTAPIILFYYDLRIRKEAFDLDALAKDLSTNPV